MSCVVFYWSINRDFVSNFRGVAHGTIDAGTFVRGDIPWERITLLVMAMTIATGAVVFMLVKVPRFEAEVNVRLAVVTELALVVLTCLFPYVSSTDRSKLPEPGHRRYHESPSGVMMSLDPILPDIRRGYRFVLSEYDRVIWKRMILQWIVISMVAGGAILSFRRSRARRHDPDRQKVTT